MVDSDGEDGSNASNTIQKEPTLATSSSQEGMPEAESVQPKSAAEAEDSVEDEGEEGEEELSEEEDLAATTYALTSQLFDVLLLSFQTTV